MLGASVVMLDIAHICFAVLALGESLWGLPSLVVVVVFLPLFWQ